MTTNKIYKSLFGFSLFLLVAVVSMGCQNNSKHTKDFSNLQNTLVTADSSVFAKMNDKPVVYYFHFTRRCYTCNAIENITKQTIEEFYKNKVTFIDFNLDEEDGKIKGEELKISGQTLLIVAGDKRINLTNEAFMNAKSNPKKLKEIIKKNIESLVK